MHMRMDTAYLREIQNMLSTHEFAKDTSDLYENKLKFSFFKITTHISDHQKICMVSLAKSVVSSQ